MKTMTISDLKANFLAVLQATRSGKKAAVRSARRKKSWLTLSIKKPAHPQNVSQALYNTKVMQPSRVI